MPIEFEVKVVRFLVLDPCWEKGLADLSFVQQPKYDGLKG
jgi:hypothetical protein